jgi:hypothetical protein
MEHATCDTHQLLSAKAWRRATTCYPIAGGLLALFGAGIIVMPVDTFVWLQFNTPF